ncbi:hypothetical protein [Ornithinimicrobium murale]|uniref:hypothetical protein n=1 Tax=Ornithinimicrobium murale TaxID=1050153 RepID=UPI000E0D3068|nr:hypothetical protein [Ornithinimicrobium murale]
MSTVFDEGQHPRGESGQFATKPAAESETDLDAVSNIRFAYIQAETYESRVGAAKEQIEALSTQVDQDSARQLGCFLQALHPDATHARLEWDEYRWHLDAALNDDGNELDIDRGSEDWYDCEDGIDCAVSQMSRNIAARPAILMNPGDGEIRNGAEAVVDVRPAQ